MRSPYLEMNVTNGPVTVGVIKVTGVASASSMLIGDSDSFVLHSFFDTPPESVIVGPMVPLPEVSEEEET
ncbi:hypothetical protein J19TS2_14030 [Cohnella xylanilytica]|nr:spore gernimation protein GerPD [Cohnella xylanilytica]GIO11848.1 hypothetical protein J19TS2_14030 [Cohnella xylanilytica]